ncbi:LysR family transcriptional regulator [Chitinibacteraceae bacterium HSL-7]
MNVNLSDQAERLVTLVQIAEAGSLSGAAQRMGVSRTVVSKHLAALENALDVRLIQRSTRSLTWTEAGLGVLHHARQIADALEHVADVSHRHSDTITGTLKVSCSGSLGREHLVPLLPRFLRAHPGVEVVLQLEDRFVDLIAEQYDLAIRIGHLPDSSLIAQRLGELRWSLVASPEYLATHGTPKHPAELSDYDCLYYRNASSSLNTWRFTGADGDHLVRVHGPLAINDAKALVCAACDGMGILLIDAAMLGDTLRSGQLVSVLDDYPPASGFPVYAVYPARTLPARTSALLQFLQVHLSPHLR